MNKPRIEGIRRRLLSRAITPRRSGSARLLFIGATLALIMFCPLGCAHNDRAENPTDADALVASTELVVNEQTPGEKTTTCLMRPPFRRLDIPEHGLVRVADDDTGGSCDVMPRYRRTDGTGTSGRQLLIDAVGPAGSGRYWTVTVRPADSASAVDADPRGVCVRTSTIGWRSLQRLGNTALPWSGDRDADGDQELILWHSFPLDAQAEASDFGLTAWIYEHRSADRLILDLSQTRALAREIAAEYASPIEGSTERLQRARTRASTALTDFADAKCSLGS